LIVTGIISVFILAFVMYGVIPEIVNLFGKTELHFVNNFGQYNKLYGSIGTIMVVLLWLYFNSFALILGFELNASINNARIDSTLG